MLYECLQGYITSCDIQIRDPKERTRFPGGRYLPFPGKSTVEWYAKSLATALRIGDIDGISQRTGASLKSWVQTLQLPSVPQVTLQATSQAAPQARGMPGSGYSQDGVSSELKEEEFEEEELSGDEDMLLRMATQQADVQILRNMQSKL